MRLALFINGGIVEGNLRDLFPPRIRNLIISGTVRDDNKIYPNNEWGFGKLSLEKLYEELLRISNSVETSNNQMRFENESKRCLYINVPMDIYKRVEK